MEFLGPVKWPSFVSNKGEVKMFKDKYIVKYEWSLSDIIEDYDYYYRRMKYHNACFFEESFRKKTIFLNDILIELFMDLLLAFSIILYVYLSWYCAIIKQSSWPATIPAIFFSSIAYYYVLKEYLNNKAPAFFIDLKYLIMKGTPYYDKDRIRFSFSKH